MGGTPQIMQIRLDDFGIKTCGDLGTWGSPIFKKHPYS